MADDERRAEIEAVRELLRAWDARELSHPEHPATHRDWAAWMNEAADRLRSDLDRVRDARGDDEAKVTVEPGRRPFDPAKVEDHEANPECRVHGDRATVVPYICTCPPSPVSGTEPDTANELERLRSECCVCEKCGHAQAEPNWCHKCGHRTTMPDWAKPLVDAFHEREVDPTEPDTAKLVEAARAFLRETGTCHPLIGQIDADAPAAVRYDETRDTLSKLLAGFSVDAGNQEDQRQEEPR